MDSRQPKNTEAGAPADKPKVLIVDDDLFLLDMYALKFSEQGFDVSSAVSGEGAIHYLKAGGDSFVVLLLDLVMPGMDGFELLKRIRDENLCSSARVVVLSNLGEPSDIEKAKQYAIDGYIIKASATPSEVVEKVREIINKA